MNPKVIKLREEREKNSEKIASLQARNKKIDADIIAIENTDIIGMVREHGISPDMLMELIKAANGKLIVLPMEEEKPKAKKPSVLQKLNDMKGMESSTGVKKPHTKEER